MIFRMAAITRRKRRRQSLDGHSVFLQARVDPEVRDRARRAADARGITVSLYMQRLILADDETPGPDEWADDEEMPTA